MANDISRSSHAYTHAFTGVRSEAQSTVVQRISVAFERRVSRRASREVARSVPVITAYTSTSLALEHERARIVSVSRNSDFNTCVKVHAIRDFRTQLKSAVQPISLAFECCVRETAYVHWPKCMATDCHGVKGDTQYSVFQLRSNVAYRVEFHGKWHGVCL